MRLVQGLRRHLLSLLLASALPITIDAQAPTTGRVTGRVIDAASGTGLSDAGVQVVGTSQGTTSGVEGRFTIGNVTPGTVTLSVRRIGYAPKTVTGLYLDAGQTLVQDISLTAATFQLTATVVTADAERGSVSTALDAQRNSVNVVSAV